jgi:N-acetylmuramoyl-L-alanine amidase
VQIQPPLRSGASGPEVTSLQLRLEQLGLSIGADGHGTYGEATAAAVRAFQRQRGLRIDGVCGHDTWASVVEAGHLLGGRLLCQRSPMLRGDDVADLQQRLGALGFDAGRLDGIFGPDTAAALIQFQRNSGVVADGICGPDTIAALRRVSGHVKGSVLAAIREEERLKGSGSQGPPRVAIGAETTFVPLADVLVDLLTQAGSDVHPLPPDDHSALAAAANGFGSDLYVHLAPGEDAGVGVAYYSFQNFTSLRGQRLANLVMSTVPPGLLGPRHDTTGMRLDVLRETKMPAIHVELGPPTEAIRIRSLLMAHITAAVVEWSTTTPS